MKTVFYIKRVYDEPAGKDGYRILIDRLWPRGLKKETAAIDEWEKDIAPTTELRKWFGHQPERWKEFQRKYFEELKKNPSLTTFMNKYRNRKIITLLYAGKDTKHTHALVLQQYLQEQQS